MLAFSVAATLSVCAVTLTPFKLASAQETADQASPINLKNADIYALIETVSRQTGKNFIVDPRVKANVTVITTDSMNADELYELLLSVLAVHGYAAVPAGNFIKNVPSTEGVHTAVPVSGEQAKSDDELISQIIPVLHVPAQQIVEALTGLLPQEASLSAEPDSNTLIVTDRAANIDRLTRLVRELDRP